MADSASLYDQDYCLWLEDQVARLKAGDAAGVDTANLIEELEDMGANQKTAIKSNLRVVLIHLLKYRYQPDKRSGSWMSTLIEHRARVIDAFSDSPSLRRHALAALPEAYRLARKRAASETGLPPETFPVDCPFELGEVLDQNYLPDAAGRAAIDGDET
jgi:hypothetical protein